MNNYIRKTYIEFLSSLMPSGKCLIREVKTRDIPKVNTSGYTIGFSFFDILSTTVVDLDGKKVKLTSERVNESPRHYWRGELYSLSGFKRQYPNDCGLLKSLKLGRGKRVIRYPDGHFHVINKDEIMV